MGNDLEKRLDDVYENYKKGNISRRDFVKFVGISGASLGVLGGPFGMVKQAFSSKKSITCHSWGGSTSEALRKFAFDPFTKATGIEVIDAAFTGMDAFLTQVKASIPPGGEFNIAHLSAVYDYARYTDLGFGVVLDESKIPNLKNVMTKMTDTLRGITKGTLSAVPYDLGQTGIAYNTKKSPRKRLKNWGLPCCMIKNLKANWLPGEAISGQTCGMRPFTPVKIPMTSRISMPYGMPLKSQRALIKKYWASGSELMSLLANGDVYATVAWSGRVAALQAQGHPSGYLSPDGTYSWMEYMYVLKGTDLDVAQKLLNFMLEPDAAHCRCQGTEISDQS